MFVIGKSFRHTSPSELQRCKLGRFFEFLHKMSEIIEPAFQTDLRDGQFGRAQQRCRMPDAKVIDIGNGCFAEGFFEKTAEVLLIHSGKCSQLSKRKRTLVVLADITDHGLEKLYARVVYRIVQGKQIILGKNSENTQKCCLDPQL